MAFNKETLEMIAKLSGVSVEDITTKANSEKEEGIEFPQGEFFTETELQKRDNSEYKKGKDAGSEMLVKDLKKRYGYEIEGKDVDSFIEHHDSTLKNKYSKGNNDRVAELEDDLKKQKIAFENEIQGLTDQKKQWEQKSRLQSLDNTLLNESPKEMTMRNDRVIALFKMENQPIEVDGVWGVMGADGQPLKNPKTGEIIPVTEKYKEYVVNEGFSKNEPGRGGGNEHGGNSGYLAKDPESFQKEWQEKNPGKSLMSQEYQKDYVDFRKESMKETA